MYFADNTTKQALLNKFGITEQNVETFDFMFFLADIFTLSVQYGTRTDLCDKYVYQAYKNHIAGDSMSMFDPIAQLATIKSVHWSDYSSKDLANTTVNTAGVGRQWTY